MQKNIAILGSTGSIGTQTLSVIEGYPDQFRVSLLSCKNNHELLLRQCRKHLPEKAFIYNREKTPLLKKGLGGAPVVVLENEEEMLDALSGEETDLVVSGQVGYAGLIPTLRALRAGKNVALANKETMVIAGELVNRIMAETGSRILPVDSEHSAIFQCLAGESGNIVEKIILTASGGPFLGRSKEYLEKVTAGEALRHPNWCMGNKISIDSATLMNKGLEAIEARWLFDLQPSQIEVVVHPQSIIHSMVCFEDGSIKAQLGLPDMRLPILYALGYPSRLKSDFPRYSPADHSDLSFSHPDLETFRNLAIALETMKRGGNAPCVMNAANEVAVEAFLKEQAGFLDIPRIIEHSLKKVTFLEYPELSDYVESDREGRKYAMEAI